MHFDFPERMCMHQSPSLSLSLSLSTFAKTVWIQIRPKWNSGKNDSSIKKFAHAIVSSVVQMPTGFQYISISVYIGRSHARIQMGVRWPGPPPPLKNHKNIEFLSKTGPDLLKFSKLRSQRSTLGHHRHASETPFSLACRWWPAFSDIWILSPLKRQRKNVAEVVPLWQNFLDPRMGPHRKRCDKNDWLTQNCVSNSKRPSQNKRFVCKHHAVSLFLSLSLSLSLSPSLSLSLSLYDLLSKFVNLLDWKTVDGHFITTCEKTQMSLCKCAFTTQSWEGDKVCQASPLLCWMVTTQTTT